MSTLPLRDRWDHRWDQTRCWLGLGMIFLEVGGRLWKRYTEPGRHYHDVRHILDCLEALDSYPGSIDNLPAIELAIWFHDAIYDPTANDNEVRSAELFRREFAPYASGTEKVESLILATRHLEQVDDDLTADAGLLLDIDLSILGSEPPKYTAYQMAIRQEFAHVDDDAFRRGRCAVLRSFLARRQIFRTRHFRRLLETSARRNLTAELDSLSDAP